MVPIGVVIGLGVARIVIATSHYVANRERVRFSAVHSLWSVLLFVMLLGVWWILWGLSHAEAERWTFFALLYLVGGPILIYLPSTLLLPDVPDEGTLDLADTFDRLGQTMMASMALFVVWLAGAEIYLLSKPVWDLTRIPQSLVCGAFVVGAAFPSRRVAAVVGAVSLLVILASFTTLRTRLI